jgi:transcriptional regulator with XRE-family HTH domain
MNRPLKHVLAENLRNYRVHAGLTQNDLATKAGTRQSRLAVMESKKSSALPRLEWLERVANSLGADVSELLSERKLSAVQSLSSLPEDEENLAAHLKELGAPLTGPAKKGRPFGPEAVVLGVLRTPSARLVECVPAVLSMNDMRRQKLLRLAYKRRLVNRLGFVVDVARKLAQNDNPERASELRGLSRQLWAKRNRLGEEFLMKDMPDNAEFRNWVRKKTPGPGKKWRVYGAYSMERFRDAVRAAA